jgi:hypothetical protein
MVGRAEIELLYQLASQVPADRCIVEIGSYRGQSAIALGLGALAGHHAPVYAIDPHEEFVGELGGQFGWRDREAFMRNVTRAKCAEVVRLVNLPGHLVGMAWEKPVGLLFLDGDHSYEGVRGDFIAWAPHLTPDATLLLDEWKNKNTGVPRLIETDLIPAGWHRTATAKDVTAMTHSPSSDS